MSSRSRISPTPAQEPAPQKGNLLLSITRSPWRIRAGLCAIALVAYADSFGLGLTGDARTIVTEDPRVREASAANLNLILHKDYWWPKSTDRLYRPVTTTSFLFNYAILGNGEAPAGYHWFNFPWHVVNIWLVYELALLLLQRAGPAFFAAALWAVHPICTEAVTNVVGRADLLSAAAVLGGLLLYVLSTTMRGWRLGLAAVALFFIASLGEFSKENAAVLAGLMLLWDIAFGIGGWRNGARRLPAYAAAVGALAVLWWVRRLIFEALPWPETSFVANPIIAADFWTARLTAMKVLGLNLWLLICPLRLSSERSYNQIPLAGWPDMSAWFAVLVVAAILAIVVARYRKDRLMFWAAGFAGITLLPTSNLLFPIASIMAERFLYLPAAAFAIALVALAYRARQQRLVPVFLAAAIALGACRTLARNLAWQDDLTLSSTDVQAAPRSFDLHANLADTLFERDPRGNIDRAIRESETAWEILRSLPPERILQQVPSNLGAYYRYKGDLEGGITTAAGRAWYEKALAVLLRAREASRAAERAYDAAQLAHGKPLRRRIGVPAVYFNLGAVCGVLGRYSEAIEAYRYGRGFDPASPEPYDALSAAYFGAGDPERAAIILLEKTQVDGFQPATMSALQELYGKIPGGSCAMVQEGGIPKLNPGCARLAHDLCLALADLARAFVEARDPGRARDLKSSAAQSYGCSAAPFD